MLLLHDRCVVCWYKPKLVVVADDIAADAILALVADDIREETKLVVADLAVVAVPARADDVLVSTVLEEITGAEEQGATQVGEEEQRALALPVDR